MSARGKGEQPSGTVSAPTGVFDLFFPPTAHLVSEFYIAERTHAVLLSWSAAVFASRYNPDIQGTHRGHKGDRCGSFCVLFGRAPLNKASVLSTTTRPLLSSHTAW